MRDVYRQGADTIAAVCGDGEHILTLGIDETTYHQVEEAHRPKQKIVWFAWM